MKVSTANCGEVKFGKTVMRKKPDALPYQTVVWIGCGKWKMKKNSGIADVEKLIE